MRGILHSMKYRVPFDHERVGGFRNLNAGVPISSSANLLPFCMPAVNKDMVVSTEYLVRIDQWGNVIERYLISDETQEPFLNDLIKNNHRVAYSSGQKSVAEVIQNNRGETLEIPCGLYYFECYFSSSNPTPPPVVDPNSEPEPENFHYKTEIFRIDKALTITGGDGNLPVDPKDKGDFSPFDFSEDFYTGDE